MLESGFDQKIDVALWVTKYDPKTNKWKETQKYELNMIQGQINEKRLESTFRVRRNKTKHENQ